MFPAFPGNRTGQLPTRFLGRPQKMLRRKFLKGAALAGAGSVGVAASFPAPALAQSMPEIKWRLPTSFPKSLDTIYGGSEFIAKRVAELTDNKFQKIGRAHV